ncbi:MAG: hypothetical protein K2X08_01805 [Chlamydiales bacterium]|nr:hypothetical protein [Chlamydiales bacterium]
MKRYVFIVCALLSSCQPGIFGVDEVVWNTLSTEEREKVIEGYNKRKEMELVNRQKRDEKQLENERHRQEVEAQTAPFYIAANALSSLCSKHDKSKGSLRISFVSNDRRTPTVGDTELHIYPFSKMSHAWVNGQKVQLLKNEESLLYPIKVINLDNGEVVTAKKSKN